MSIRQNIRNAYIIESLATIEAEAIRRRASRDNGSAEALEEMAEECKRAGVDNFGRIFTCFGDRCKVCPKINSCPQSPDYDSCRDCDDALDYGDKCKTCPHNH